MLVEVAFKGNRKEFFHWNGDEPLPVKAAVIVEADRGEDLGFIYATGELAEKRVTAVAHKPTEEEPVSREVRRLATPDELKRVADTGGCMPPKSTYIEPKLRSGITVYSLEDE